MTNKKILFALTLGVLLFGSVGVLAYQNSLGSGQGYYYPERHDAMQEAFLTEDYSAWYDLMSSVPGHARVIEFVTADEFGTFVEARDTYLSGDLETSQDLRASIGLNPTPREGIK